uniref:uncharacterized protein LOC120334074 n=1 Tax=Styela clava TaxID=7725 RepID=UPI00193A09F1|nr:uncharacterized protein LOC120334074 [Styela clava]
MEPRTLVITLTIALFKLGYSSSQYTSPPFHRTFSDACISAGIKDENACPRIAGKSQWSKEKRTSESDTRFKPTNPRKCFSKVLVSTQKCNAKPECVMTAYKYSLPNRGRSAGKSNPSHCIKDWSIESTCKANGPGGKNTRTTYFNCFRKGARNFCGVKFENCKPVPCFTWTGYKRQCFMECKTPKFTGIAMHFVRNCKECGGDITNNTNCSGGEEAATRLGRCIVRSKARARAPDCVLDTTTAIVTTAQPETTRGITTAKITKLTTTTIQTSPHTTYGRTITTPETFRTSTAIKKLDATTSHTTKAKITTGPNNHIKTKPTKTVLSTTKQDKTEPTTTTSKSTTTKQTTGFTKSTATITTTSTTIVPDYISVSSTKSIVRATTTNPRTTSLNFNQEESTAIVAAIPGGQSGHDDNPFNLVTIAGGAGAGIIFIVLIAIIIFLLMKRDTKTPPGPAYSSSSLYRSRSGRNPVVDSSSFRIATWIRERPALPNRSRTSSDSGVSDAEYWKIGESSEEKIATPNKSQTSIVPDIVKIIQVEGEEHIYDEVSFGMVQDDMQKFVPITRDSPFKNSRTSAKSTHSEPAETSTSREQEWPRSESAVYAVVRKTRKRNANYTKKSPSEAGDGDFRRRVASEHSASITRLNGRHLREGVLQIEFDEKEGLRCRLSNSNVYMNFEETEPPPVI